MENSNPSEARMQFDVPNKRGLVLILALAAFLALANDVVAAVLGLYRWAVTSNGQAVLLVGILLLTLFLVIDRVAGERN